jgi:hypothetical protein
MAGWYLMSCLNKHGKRKLNKSGYALSRYVADNTIFPLIRIEQSVVQVDSVGLGCCMVTRKLLKKAKIKMGEDIYIKDVYGKNIIHDDSSYFSNIVARLGYCLWADGSVVCKHLIGKT